MSSTRLAFSSDRPRALSAMAEGETGFVVDVNAGTLRGERLFALGVTPGAQVTVLQTFPGIVFLCDQTELVVERAIAREIWVRSSERP
jgi:Fe2+ transport system protein FeoA